jgi:flagellar biosynthesis protein FlhG
LNSQAHRLEELIQQTKTTPNSSTKTLAITSGKGGVGKSTISANLGYLFSSLGLKVAMFDADFGLANLDIMFNVKCNKNILDIIKGTATLRDVVVHVDDNLILIPGDSGEEILKYNNDQASSRLLEELKLLNNIDVMIIDTGAGIGEYVQRFLSATDEIVVLVTPDPSSITDAYATIKATSRHTKRISVVLNNSKNDKEAQKVFDKINKVVEYNIKDMKLEYLGTINKSSIISDSVLRRALFAKNEPNSKPSLELEKVAKSILPKLEHNMLIRDKKTVNKLFRTILGRF